MNKFNENIPDSVTLSQILGEDDTATLTIDGMQIQVEQSTPGVNPAFDLIGLTQLRNDPRFAGIDGSGFSVAVIDTGLDATHPEIRPNFAAFVNFDSNNRSVITNPNQTSYTDPHGTHVAGTIGSPNENIGVAPAVKLIGLQVFVPNGTGGVGAPGTLIEDALQWVIDNRSTYNITAINMSLGGGFYTSPTEASGDPWIVVR